MKVTLPRWAVLALAGALAIAVVYAVAEGTRASQLDAELSRSRGERLEAMARADGWETRWAETVPDLLAEAAEKDSMIARLRDEARLAGAQPVARVVAEASVRVDTVLVADTVRPPAGADWARQWTFAGPVVFGSAWYIPPDSLGTAFRIRTRAELIGTLAPDGRLLVTGRALDSGVELEVQRFEWSPPEREKSRRWPWIIGAFAAGVLAWEIAR